MAGECAALPCDLDASGKLAKSALENRLAPPQQSTSQQRIEQLVSAKSAPVEEDPNLDPFYLERSLEDSKSWGCHAVDDTDVELEDLEIEYFMSYMTDDKQKSPVHNRYQPQSFQAPVYATPSNWKRTPVHYSQSSCSSIRTDATGLTPDLTPSSSFSSTYSVPNCPEAVRKATEQLALHSDRIRRQRSGSAARFYLPVATPPTQWRACTRPSTPVERPATAAPYVEENNLSTETLTMIQKDPPAPAASSSSLRSKPLPSLPPLTRNPSSGPAPPKKCHSPGPRSPIDAALISPPSLINPVTMEPHASHFDHALFIPAHDCPSPVPNPTAPPPTITRQATSASSKGRPSTSTSVAHGEQSVWESDSDSESIITKSHYRRGPIETLRKVRSRVQLRRMAKSEGKLHADIHATPPKQDDTTPKLPQQPYVAPPAVASVTSIPDVLLTTQGKPTLRLVAPSMTSLPQPQSRHSSSEKEGYEINTTAAAAIQAQTRRRQRSYAEETVPFSKEEFTHERYYCQTRVAPRVDSDQALSLNRRSMFQRVWGSLRALNCRSDR
ncbi:hypothetical protein VTN77DRAFT_2255 [Rasamsonia byssochlamydoides]|uniref:uncharacterized protein n=1 Tax=Rasamsonia byssochlamydoides TaxID=89139 RepID=UPI003742F752